MTPKVRLICSQGTK